MVIIGEFCTQSVDGQIDTEKEGNGSKMAGGKLLSVKRILQTVKCEVTRGVVTVCPEEFVGVL